ncbi:MULTISPECIES: hypothetical protein [Nitrosopumilus]|uniref:hypothetical protein n=1 Tax=Nitrosopumilus TaxID=338191 RepID=UPI000A409EEF|nr:MULTISPECIES: hypothetical protein [Nitrosopumilus]KAF6245578.1 hypothetical protein C6989_00045 [Nitrosopumilus sp. b2]
MNKRYSFDTIQQTETENEPAVKVYLNNYTIKRICKNCGNRFEYNESEYCSSECVFEDVEKIIVEVN